MSVPNISDQIRARAKRLGITGYALHRYGGVGRDESTAYRMLAGRNKAALRWVSVAIEAMGGRVVWDGQVKIREDTK